ncbi:hypothetical protein AAY473_004796, partial [Plecturocebus cupreus]
MDNVRDAPVLSPSELLACFTDETSPEEKVLQYNITDNRVSLCHPGWSAVAQSQLTATSTSGAQGVLLLQRPEEAGIIGMHHHAQLIFVFLVDHVGQAGLELLISDDPPASASPNAGITGDLRCCLLQPVNFSFLRLSRKKSNGTKNRRNLSVTQAGWSAEAPSRLTADSASQIQEFSCLNLLKMGFHHVSQVGLELLTSSDLPISASQSAEITGLNHLARLYL